MYSNAKKKNTNNLRLSTRNVAELLQGLKLYKYPLSLF